MDTSLYQRVDYLQSTGTQYIATGISAGSAAFRATLDFSYDRFTSECAVIGSQGGFELYCVSSGVMSFWTASSSDAVATLSAGARYMLDIIKSPTEHQVDVDGTSHTVSAVSSFGSSPISIFGYGAGRYLASGKMYSCKIYSGNSLVRDYVPCVRLADMIGGLYDTVSDTFFTNVGTGTFLYPFEYVFPTANWDCTEDGNGGYPYPTDTSLPEPYDPANVYTPWVCGAWYPYIYGCEPIPFDGGGIYSVWHFDAGTNLGYPYIIPIMDYTLVSVEAGHPPVQVYEAGTTDFTQNGMRCLVPISCTSVEEYNGGWELSLEHPIDADGAWQALQTGAILKAPITFRSVLKPQLFRIYSADTKMDDSGAASRFVRARHIFYDLSDCWLDDVRPTDCTCLAALDWLLDHAYVSDGETTPASAFTVDSDIDTATTAYYDSCSVVSAIMGADNSILSRWGGELYRDNHYFSVRSSRENSVSNAFSIVYGIDMTAITETIDYSDFCDRLLVDAQDAGARLVLNGPSAWSKPHRTTKHISLSYDEFNADIFASDAQAIFDGMSTPSVSYTVAFAKLIGLPQYTGFSGLQSCEVGDTGSIRNQLLDIRTTQRVIRKTIDVLTDTCTSVELGNIRGSLTRKAAYSGTILSPEMTPIERQMKLLERSKLGLWVGLKGMAYGSVKRYTWGEIKG